MARRKSVVEDRSAPVGSNDDRQPGAGAVAGAAQPLAVDEGRSEAMGLDEVVARIRELEAADPELRIGRITGPFPDGHVSVTYACPFVANGEAITVTTIDGQPVEL